MNLEELRDDIFNLLAKSYPQIPSTWCPDEPPKDLEVTIGCCDDCQLCIANQIVLALVQPAIDEAVKEERERIAKGLREESFSHKHIGKQRIDNFILHYLE
jgi:hypothetical protein